MRLKWALLPASALGLVLLIATSWPHGASAQDGGTPPTPQPIPTLPAGHGQLVPGTIVWAFGNEPPFFDERVATALTTIVNSRLASAGLARVTADASGFGLTLVSRADQVALLLAAAGFPQSPPFVEVGQCRLWVSASATRPTVLTPAGPAPVLAAAIQEALGSLKIQTRRCEPTMDPTEAHLLVWVYGDPPPPLPQRREPTFLSWQGYVSPGPRAPIAPATGGAGLTSSEESTPIAAAFAVVLLLLVARHLTRAAVSERSE